MHVHVRNLKLKNDIRGVPYVKLIKLQILDLRSMKNSTFRKHRMVLVCWKCVYSIRFPAVYRRKYRYARTTKLHWFTYANHDELLTMHVPNVPLRLRLIETHISSHVGTYLYLLEMFSSFSKQILLRKRHFLSPIYKHLVIYQLLIPLLCSIDYKLVT